MSEAEKKIEEYIEEAYVGLRDDKQAPFTVGDLKAETRDDIEFGYQLGKDEYKAALRREIDNYQEKYGDNQGPIDYTLAKILELLDTVEP